MCSYTGLTEKDSRPRKLSTKKSASFASPANVSKESGTCGAKTLATSPGA